MDYEPAIARGMHIKLHPVCLERDGPAESRTTVLVLVSGGAPMGEVSLATHGALYGLPGAGAARRR
jgi:hypothetical protein